MSCSLPPCVRLEQRCAPCRAPWNKPVKVHNQKNTHRNEYNYNTDTCEHPETHHLHTHTHTHFHTQENNSKNTAAMLWFVMPCCVWCVRRKEKRRCWAVAASRKRPTIVHNLFICFCFSQQFQARFKMLTPLAWVRNLETCLKQVWEAKAKTETLWKVTTTTTSIIIIIIIIIHHPSSSSSASCVRREGEGNFDQGYSKSLILIFVKSRSKMLGTPQDQNQLATVPEHLKINQNPSLSHHGNLRLELLLQASAQPLELRPVAGLNEIVPVSQRLDVSLPIPEHARRRSALPESQILRCSRHFQTPKHRLLPLSHQLSRIDAELLARTSAHSCS